MAIYHLSVKPHTRSKGQSAVASAAYRSGERLYDDRVGRTFNYQNRRRSVLHAEVVAPRGHPIPERQALWQAQERATARRNARVAREVEVALPDELTPKARVGLARELARALAERYGVAVDLAVHAPGPRSDHRNTHAHLLLTTWTWSAEGRIGNRVRAFDGSGGAREVRELRALWADCCNRALELAGSRARVDHRSHRDRGIDRVPQRKLGAARHIEARGGVSRLAAAQRGARIERSGGEHAPRETVFARTARRGTVREPAVLSLPRTRARAADREALAEALRDLLKLPPQLERGRAAGRESSRTR